MTSEDFARKVAVKEGRQIALVRVREYLRKEQQKPGYRRRRNKIHQVKKSTSCAVKHPKPWDDRATLGAALSFDNYHKGIFKDPAAKQKGDRSFIKM